MSWTDKELSDMARKAEADHAFAYQDSFWGEMEAMLPAKKKPLWPLFLGIAVPIVGIATFLLISPKVNLEPTNAVKITNFDRNQFISSDQLRSNNESIQTETGIESKTSIFTAKPAVFNSASSQNTIKSGVNTKQLSSITEMKQNNPEKQNDKGISPIEIASISKIDQQIEKETNAKNQIPSNEKSTSLMAVTTSTEKNESDVAKDINRLKFNQLSTFDMQHSAQPTMLTHRSKRRFFSAYGELGFSVGEAYLNNQVGHVQSIALGAGARLTKNKLFVQTGLGFDIEKAGVELSETTREYGYGVKTFENRMNYREMYRAFIPVTVGYIINKHTLQFGATASYLMSTRMKYAYLENESMKRNEIIYGETKGWNSFGMKVNVGYGFSLFPSTTIGANFQVQLMNQLNANWAQDENKLPISGQVFIRKTIR